MLNCFLGPQGLWHHASAEVVTQALLWLESPAEPQLPTASHMHACTHRSCLHLFDESC